jgi:hypothetical protein
MLPVRPCPSYALPRTSYDISITSSLRRHFRSLPIRDTSHRASGTRVRQSLGHANDRPNTSSVRGEMQSMPLALPGSPQQRIVGLARQIDWSLPGLALWGGSPVRRFRRRRRRGLRFLSFLYRNAGIRNGAPLTVNDEKPGHGERRRRGRRLCGVGCPYRRRNQNQDK